MKLVDVMTATVLFLLGLSVLVWPWLAYMDYEFTRVDTDYWSLRYVCYTLYILLMQVMRADTFDVCQQLIGEGFLVSQITTMLLYN